MWKLWLETMRKMWIETNDVVDDFRLNFDPSFCGCYTQQKITQEFHPTGNKFWLPSSVRMNIWQKLHPKIYVTPVGISEKGWATKFILHNEMVFLVK